MKKFINDFTKYFKYTIYAAKSDLKSEIANSHLSWLWWILDPLLFMLVYTFISVIVFGTSQQYFPIFVFIGLSCWTFFEKVVKTSVTLVSSNSAIVSKVYIPKFMLIFVKMYVQGFKMLVSFSLVIIMMLIWRVQVGIEILWVIPLFILLILVTFAVSSIMLHFGVFVEDLSNIITVLLKLAFYLSGIFYTIRGRVPAPFDSLLLKGNPVAFIMDGLRNSMLYQSNTELLVYGIWLLVSVIVSIIGIKVIYKYENSYVKVI